MKIRPVWAELFRAEGQTDGRTYIHDEANSLFFVIFRTRLKTPAPIINNTIAHNKRQPKLLSNNASNTLKS